MKLSTKILAIIFVATVIGILWTIYFIIPAVDAIIGLTPLTGASNETARDLTRIALIYFFGIYPTSILMLYLFSKEIVRPIKTLNETAKKIALGYLRDRVEVDSNDEIGELAENLNRILTNLARGMQEMANSLRDERIKEAELAKKIKELADEKNRGYAILSSIGEGVAAVNNNRQIILFNQAASEITKLSREQVMGQPYDHILRFVLDKKVEGFVTGDFIEKALDGTPSQIGRESSLITRQGYKVPVAESSAPILDAANRVTGAVVVFRDASKERQFDRMKDEFVSVASHELRTPMTAIKGLVSMIFDGDYGPLNQNLYEPLTDIFSSTERLISLVNDLLDISRIEGGRIKFSLSDFVLDGVVDEMLKLMAPVAAQKKIVIKSGDKRGIKIYGDENKVKQIFSNLVGNSMKFTDQGEIIISYKVEGDLAYIYVTDTGIGIPLQGRDNLFSKFYQVNNAQLGRPKGTGLGLYISREYAQMMGGNLWLLESIPNEKTTFCLTLPLSDSILANKIKALHSHEEKV